MKSNNEKDSKASVEKKTVKNTLIDIQRIKLEKLMKNPEKPVVIPDRQKQKRDPHVPEFVRNVMGSSAGAGSGEFHVYRHLRRKEYARQKNISEKSAKNTLDEEFQQKLVENQKKAEERTAKKRAKRLKKRQNLKKKKIEKAKMPQFTDAPSDSKDSESESDDSNDDESKASATPTTTETDLAQAGDGSST
ncbi:unnamed protein product [Nesidiocoris tenuis]|uniref:Uncharacterized protein n=2 Tax=Nesidiocoris tenuis TaxID=355587 RepID=A0ABN7B0M9_9HEMI|nr:Protein of unknown function (DUF1168) [Nesidiocoris tenuis]CAB0004573.1 unnamed protein product [Nesidiocoris tenuis]